MPRDLADIKTFPALVKYLKEDLDWPIDSENFEDLTFEYTPEELGIEAAVAAKIVEIKRLRPLTSQQPWGVFFVRFEPKKLPIVALRRILSRLVVKKRSSANSAERASWNADDLMFISAYGEGATRQLSFAHFSQDLDRPDLPTLKVLGWDSLDTPLHLERVEHVLKTRLSWPADERAADAWRTQWRAAFSLRPYEVIKTSRSLATELAALARAIRARLLSTLNIETEKGPATRLMNAFREGLIHDLSREQFADMYAQTIAYGLLSARIANPQAGKSALLTQLPVTSPFLKELMAAFIDVGGSNEGEGIDFDELGIADVVDLLDLADLDAVLADFGDRNPREDPVIHFYESFLAEYSPSERMKRGVFYTPKPVVKYIVESVDHQLRQDFGLAHGLASIDTWSDVKKRIPSLVIPPGISGDDAFVTILDPATGTGTFIVETIDRVYRTLRDEWAKQGVRDISTKWTEYVDTHLLSRLFGFELLMAPYAIAHVKVGLKLHETGYRFTGAAHSKIYLTNSLEPSRDSQVTLELPALAREVQEVNRVKREKAFTVVIGNPPYAGVSSNLSSEVRATIDAYRYVDDVKIKEKSALQFEKNLNDDYVKFLRLAEKQLEKHVGVIGYITNNGYQDSTTLRGLRNHVLKTSSSRFLVDLHGDADKRERAPDGGPDENVFEIKRGVAILILSKSPKPADEILHRHDVLGQADEKLTWLEGHNIASTTFTDVRPRPPQYAFVASDAVLAEEYAKAVAVTELLDVNSTGFESGRDEILTAFRPGELADKIEDFATAPVSDLKKKYSVEVAWGKTLLEARKTMTGSRDWKKAITPFLFAPFDIRYCFYRKELLKTNSFSAGKHLLSGGNRALVVMRQVSFHGPFTHSGVTTVIPNNRAFYSTKGKVSYFPLWLNREGGNKSQRVSNFRPAAIERFAAALRAESGDAGAAAVEPESLFDYTYAILNSETYRSRFASFLKSEFPRIPLPGSISLFRELAGAGRSLSELHLGATAEQRSFAFEYDSRSKAWSKAPSSVIRFLGPEKPEVGSVWWEQDSVRIAPDARFSGVAKETWEAQFGGYRIAEKWLKDRKGQHLDGEDLNAYARMLVALRDTPKLAGQVDRIIEKNGGWPGAFSWVDGGSPPGKGNRRLSEF